MITMQVAQHNADCYKVSDDPLEDYPIKPGDRGRKFLKRIGRMQPATATWDKNADQIKVVNLRPGPLNQMGYNSVEHWLENENHLYIGRNLQKHVPSARYFDDRWGNPYKMPEYSREQCLAMYERHARERLVGYLSELTGKTLGCWCDPDPCHGHVLVRLYKEFVKR